MKGLLIVSGCPRSGTSVCMDIQRAAHGEDRILGQKFPQEERKKRLDAVLNSDTPQGRIRRYLAEKRQTTDDSRWKNMNPEGFWEMEFTCSGIRHMPRYQKVLQDSLAGDYRICKVVSHGLLASDPSYIGKIIYMIRHPRVVATSQENLIHDVPEVMVQNKSQGLMDGIVLHSPETYTRTTVAACHFFLDHPEIPVRFYHYESLMDDTETVLSDMQGFVGCGDYAKARDIVQTKLNRSKPRDVASPLWEDAEYVYGKFSQASEAVNSGDTNTGHTLFREIVDYMSDIRRATNRSRRRWICPRLRRQVCEAECKLCVSDHHTRNNFRQSVDYRPASGGFKHWSEEPCLFECGLDLDRTEYLTIEESIINNFWKTPEETIICH